MTNMSMRSLPELLEFIVDNRGRTCPVSDSGLPLIATNCLKAGKREAVLENVRYVDERTYSDWFRAHPEPRDVLFVCKGTPGRVAMVPDPVPYCIAQDMVALRAKRDLVHPEYLYYLLSSPEVQRDIGNMHVGTMIPHFKKGDFGKLKLLVHTEVSEQQAIAEVLGALDDKIAANDLILQRSVELADLEFLKARRDASGDNATFESVAAVSGGGTPKTKVDEYWNGDVPWATPTDVTGLSGPYLTTTGRSITESGLGACASRLYPPGSLLMTSRATIGAFAINSVPMAVNQGFIVVNATDRLHQWWLFHEMRSRVSEFLSHANGATFLELSRGSFKKLSLRMPSDSQAANFTATAGALHAHAAQVKVESAVLARTRDELLPLLMAGKIRVEEAEKAVSDRGL